MDTMGESYDWWVIRRIRRIGRYEGRHTKMCHQMGGWTAIYCDTAKEEGGDAGGHPMHAWYHLGEAGDEHGLVVEVAGSARLGQHLAL